MRPWQNKKAIVAAVLLVAAAFGGYTFVSTRKGGEEQAFKAKPAVVKAGMGARPGAAAGSPRWSRLELPRRWA